MAPGTAAGMKDGPSCNDTPRSLRRCDPDQVPRDCLNPPHGDTPGGCNVKLGDMHGSDQPPCRPSPVPACGRSRSCPGEGPAEAMHRGRLERCASRCRDSVQPCKERLAATEHRRMAGSRQEAQRNGGTEEHQRENECPDLQHLVADCARRVQFPAERCRGKKAKGPPKRASAEEHRE